LEAMNSSRSCPAGSNLRQFKSQAGGFDEFPMSLSKQSSLIDKGNGVGSSIPFFEPIPGAVSGSNSYLAGKAEISEASR
jgi:hypothetical protein